MAVFTEEGASASQMAAAKFLEAISKLLSMAGEAGDKVSVYIQVKMTEAPSLIVTIARRMSRHMESGFFNDKDQKVGIRMAIL